MLSSIKQKILDIEAKISNSSLLNAPGVNPLDSIGVTSIPRHSALNVQNISANFNNLNNAITDTLTVMQDFDKLFVYFFNQKEGQISALNDRYMRMDLKQKILRSLENGPVKNVISLNDSSLISPGKTFELTSSGISFPLLSEKRIIPDSITILRDSNINIGDVLDPGIRSMREAITSADQNDVFSVYRKDKADLKLSFFCEFSRKEIINEVTLSIIKKEGQKIFVRIQDNENGKILEDLEYTDPSIHLKRPISTNRMYITVTAKAIDKNQIDFKELSFYQKEYKKQGSISTIGMPLLGNKYLTFENLTLKDHTHLPFLNIEVKANGEILESASAEGQAKGPYKDPVLTLNYTLKDDASVFNLINTYKYKVGTYSSTSDIYKSFVKIATNNPFSVREARTDATTQVIPIAIPGLESFFDVFLNGTRCVRVTGLITAPYQYKIMFTGNGYRLYFQQIENEADLVIYINSVPSYYEDKSFVFPSLGLGTNVTVSSAGKTFTKKINLRKDENNSVLLAENYIQAIRFLSSVNQEYTCTEKELNSTLGSMEYSIDYVNGILYLGEGISGFCEITALKTFTASSVLDEESLRVTVHPETEGFTYSSNLTGLVFNKSNVFGYQKYNGVSGGIDLASNTIKIPSFLSIHKNSIQLTSPSFSKKEVEYIDGITELEIDNYIYDYYDYLPSEINTEYYLYVLRGTSTLADRQLSFNSSKLLSRKTIPSTSVTTLDELKPLIISALQVAGDYYVLGNNATVEPFKYLYVKKESSVPVNFSYEVKAYEDIGDKYFSVDYQRNILYTKNLSAFMLGSITFFYSSLFLNEFTIAKQIENKTQPEGEEYNAIVYNREESKALLPYFTPILESLSIGTIG
jgi:hypothetical protein